MFVGVCMRQRDADQINEIMSVRARVCVCACVRVRVSVCVCVVRVRA